MLGRRAQRGWLGTGHQGGSFRILNRFEPPRQQPLAAVCPSLSKEGTDAVFIEKSHGRSGSGPTAYHHARVSCKRVTEAGAKR